MTTRRTTSNARRDSPKSNQGKGGGLFTGLFIGLIIGLVFAAGLAWYLTQQTPEFKTTEIIPAPQPKRDATEPAEPHPADHQEQAAAVEPVPAPKTTSPARPAPTPSAPLPAPVTAPETAPKPRVDYTFYGILPGDKPGKQALPPPSPQPSNDVWWLQVAALKNPAEAEKLKARLSLLGLNVAMHKITSGDVELYRIRVGPYNREDAAFGDLDTLAENNFEPRLFKDPSTQSAPEKP